MNKPKACRSTLKAPAAVAMEPAAMERRNTAARLRRSRASLEDGLHRLEVLHADRSGAYRIYYPILPLIPEEFRQRNTSVALTKRQAAAGCQLCAEWLAETAALRERIEALRNTPLPERAPDYDPGRWTSPSEAARAGKMRARYYMDHLPPADVPKLLSEREVLRKERGAAFRAEWLREIEEAKAKAAANVPH